MALSMCTDGDVQRVLRSVQLFLVHRAIDVAALDMEQAVRPLILDEQSKQLWDSLDNAPLA